MIKNSNAFKEVAIIKHPRMGQYMFGLITAKQIFSGVFLASAYKCFD
ncbi:hypothetical protein Goari_027071 [Gossypium aridum]|uniref:Uncharacterized protein n=1 Tax=Gossypium aridum TaxID=34290 RepID=A0A7J8YT76_GOSAI|nr:hypothetical protein [Gossypium aridum]